MGRRWRRFWALLLSSCLFFGVVWPVQAQRSRGVPWPVLLQRGIEILQWSNLSDRQEVQLGRQIHQQLLTQEFQVYPDPELQRYVATIGQRLASVSDRPNLPYEFTVVRSSQVNAFATLGGFVYVTTGLLRAADNEAQLAGVLGHEIGHIVHRHLVQQLREVAIAQGVSALLGTDGSQLNALLIELALRRPRSRQHEFEADASALQYLLRAGYDGRGLPEFLGKLRGYPPALAFLSTHPAPETRIAALQRLLPPNLSGDGMDATLYRQRVLSRL
ncbi:MAG: M48 family metallopeptidase [Gloeomargarita sp. SKYG116]|nr:M48 family metallopeptidase [Gloeomargarita sp. SKYG116]MDW8400566.1 M48 family metallopeptidase [Gloeomargarita sp. SKYGB_i_bin116]